MSNGRRNVVNINTDSDDERLIVQSFKFFLAIVQSFRFFLAIAYVLGVTFQTFHCVHCF